MYLQNLFFFQRSLDSPSNSTLLVGVGSSGTPANLDSDLEIEPDPPDWNRNVDPQTLVKLSTLDLKRQEIINGNILLFY